MNMTEATLSGSNGSLAVEFAGFRLALPQETLTARPALRAHEGKQLIVGIRPEDMEDASFAGDPREDRTIRAKVELREALGSDVVVHFPVDAPAVVTEDVKELAEDVGQEAVESLEQGSAGGRSVFLARLNPRTKAKVGQGLDLHVDTGHLHFFDPETGRAIYGDSD
jgi:multiple sugar transport system ATP-binding protein